MKANGGGDGEGQDAAGDTVPLLSVHQLVRWDPVPPLDGGGGPDAGGLLHLQFVLVWGV
jgi:hypothetical protein